MKRSKLFAVAASLVCAALLFCGCEKTNTSADVQEMYTFTDDLKRQVSIKYNADAAVCSGSFAKVWQLAGGTLCAATQDAWEESSLSLEGVIDLGSLKNPSAELILDCGADLVVLSANTKGQLELEDVLESAGMTIAYFDVETFPEYLEMLRIFTDISGKTENYELYGESVKKRVEAAIASCEKEEPKRILLLRAYSSGVKAKGSDNMTGEMLSDLGAVNIADSDTSLLEDLSMERILEEDPEIIFVTTMGDSNEAIKRFEADIKSHPAFASLTAVKEGRVYILEKDLFHNKPNARWGESYEILAKIIKGE